MEKYTESYMKESDEVLNKGLASFIKSSKIVDASSGTNSVKILEKHGVTMDNYSTLTKEQKAKILAELMFDYAGDYTEQIINDYETSYNFHPQSHIPVGKNEMLHINISMGDNTYQAFVDTGAGLSFMSRKVMVECGLEKRLNKKYRTKAIGVGSSITLGKIFNLDFTIGPATLTWNFSVMEQGPDFLIGLDILKYCVDSIDIKTNTISFNGIPIPLLKSHEVNDESSRMQHIELLAKETGKSVSELLAEKESHKETEQRSPISPSSEEEDLEKAIAASLKTATQSKESEQSTPNVNKVLSDIKSSVDLEGIAKEMGVYEKKPDHNPIQQSVPVVTAHNTDEDDDITRAITASLKSMK